MKAEKPCPLCSMPDQEVLIELPKWRLARTKTMKGHRERLMLLFREHVKLLDEQSVGEAYMLLLTMGQRLFSYANQWAIFEPVYATVPDHWHRVASDLDARSEDYEQILKTPRLVVDRDTMAISRVVPKPEAESVGAKSASDQARGQKLKVDAAPS
ncbi:MAG TPA: hypothetical protein VE955_12385 [Candidatus Dormibacteraeota bacterium]|nr:hypothetical protein [Candidatus Dormibacteraeota bacterium]